MVEIKNRLQAVETNIAGINVSMARMDANVENIKDTLKGLCCKEHITKINELELKYDDRTAEIKSLALIRTAEVQAKAILDTANLAKEHGEKIHVLELDLEKLDAGIFRKLFATAVTIIGIIGVITAVLVNTGVVK